jgi:hypothetical protein
MLDSPGVMSVVGEFEAAGMAQHMGMDGEADACNLTGTSEDLSHIVGGERPPAFGQENINALGIVTAQTAQGAQLGSADRMGRGGTVLSSSDVQQALAKIDLVPTQGDEFADSQPVPIGQENQRRVPVTVTTAAASGIHEGVHFLLGQVFAGALLSVPSALWRNFPIYSVWRALPQPLKRQDIAGRVLA